VFEAEACEARIVAVGQRAAPEDFTGVACNRTALRLCVLASIPRTVRGAQCSCYLSLAIVIEFLKTALRVGMLICLILVDKVAHGFVQAVFDGTSPDIFWHPGILQFLASVILV
jgi:hypothetical protein